jgi:hypothetical protein
VKPTAVLLLFSAMALSTSCAEPPLTVLGRLMESRRLSAELLVQFAKATEAGNRAVMADSADASSVAADDLKDAMKAIDRDSAALAAELDKLSYAPETELLSEFQKRLSEFRALDREILDLAQLDTNVKAQRLSFGPAQESADALRDALADVAKSVPQNWQVRALTAEVLASVREIQALQAPHIVEPEDAAMSKLEARIDRAASSAKQDLASLASVSRLSSPASLAAASAALDRFISTHAEIVKLSRSNSNVRSLALALGKRRTLAAACEERLRALQAALENRDIGPGR